MIENEDILLAADQVSTYREIFAQLQGIEKRIEETVQELKAEWTVVSSRLELTRMNNEKLFSNMEKKYNLSREELEIEIVKALSQTNNPR